MNGDEQTHRVHQFVERVGLLWGTYGGQPMVGRVLGWLLVCAPPVQSITEIAAGVMASKASISTASRTLERIGLVERVPVRGDRGAYYRVVAGGWVRLFEVKHVTLRLVRELAAEGLTVLDDAPASHRERLQELHDLYEFLEREMPKIIAAWRKSRLESP